MFQNKPDTILFLLYIGVLIFAEKITDHHHAYNGRSEITHMNLVTCNFTAKVWRSISRIISIFTCRILRSIVRGIKKSKYLYYNALSNKFQAEWNVAKINSNGKCILHCLIFYPDFNFPIYAVSSKLPKLGQFL